MSTAEPNTPPLVGLPEMPDVIQHLVKPNEPVVAKIHATRICTASKKAAGFVRHIEVDVSGTPLENGWISGQSFGVIPSGCTDKGSQHKLRLYSIASPTKGETGDGTIMATSTKRVVDEDWDTHELMTGVCSNYMCDLKVGDPITITGPAGKRFVLPKDPSKHDYIFIATGTGIAPFRSMISDLIELGMPSKATLIMGAPYATDLLYHDTMTSWKDEHPNFTYRTAISRHLVEGQSRKLYVQDRLTEDAEELLPMLASERTLIYICGIAGMELGILQTLARMLPSDQLAQYLSVDPKIGSDIDSWERKMIPRTVKPTKRVFLEVY
jgi:ferredoxin--NADP+ reductase